VQTYRSLFGVPEFRALFATQCLSIGASSIGSLAIGTITYQSTGSPILTSLAMFGGPLIRLASTWFFASAADLLRPRAALMFVALIIMAADGLQALPHLAWGVRFVILALPWLAMSATGGSMIALVSDIVPRDGFVFARATMNIAVGVMQIFGYGAGGILLLYLSTSHLFLCAAAAAGLALVVVRFRIADHPPRAAGQVIGRSRAVNRQLLGSRQLRPILLALWVPNGLIVGCEALFVPYAGRHAGYLFAAADAGMLFGDVMVGRFLTPALRDRLVEPLRLLLAAPYLLFVLAPALPVAAAVATLSSIGYSASLPLQERMLNQTDPTTRGHVLGLNGTCLLAMQGIGALLSGTIAEALGSTTRAAATAIAVMALASLTVTMSLIPGLRRSALGADLPVPT
jgi:predicted MFS family arabinose efflux permease